MSSVRYAEYNYTPMIFTAIEKEIGEKAMWKWMKAILKTDESLANAVQRIGQLQEGRRLAWLF